MVRRLFKGFWNLSRKLSEQTHPGGLALRAGCAMLCALLLTPILLSAAQTFRAEPEADCCRSSCHCRYCSRHEHRDSSPGEQTPFFAAKTDCPCSPNSVPTFPSFGPALVVSCCSVRDVAAHSAGLPQSAAGERLVPIRDRQKRGPPFLFC